MKKIILVLYSFINIIICKAEETKELFDLLEYTKKTSITFKEFKRPFLNIDSKSIEYRGKNYPINFDDIQWNKGSGDDTDNTYRVFINSFDFIEPLIVELIDGNYKNFYNLKKIIFSYIRNKDYIVFQWYDHAMGKRSQLLSVFYLTSNHLMSEEEKLELKERLKLEKEQLLNEKLYTKVGNHGIFQDIGLLAISKILEDQITFNFGLKRLLTHFNTSFSSEGVHLENSTGYQQALYLMFNQIFESIKLDFEEKKILEKTKKLVDVENNLISRGDTFYREKKDLNKNFIIEKIQDGLVYFSN